MESRKLETAAELSEFLTVSPSTIYMKAKQRFIPCYRLGDRLLFDRAEVLAAIRVSTDDDHFQNLKMTPSGRR